MICATHFLSKAHSLQPSRLLLISLDTSPCLLSSTISVQPSICNPLHRTPVLVFRAKRSQESHLSIIHFFDTHRVNAFSVEQTQRNQGLHYSPPWTPLCNPCHTMT